MNSLTNDYNDAQRQSDELSEEIIERLYKFNELPEEDVIEAYILNYGQDPISLEEVEDRIRKAITGESFENYVEC